MSYWHQANKPPTIGQLLFICLVILLFFIGFKNLKASPPQRIQNFYIPNNNPGNIKKGDAWLGESPICKSQHFVCFNSSEWGLRALAIVLHNYYIVHNLNTVTAIITRYAPPSENNTKLYIAFVSYSLGVKKDSPLNLQDPFTLAFLMNAIITYEQGHDPFNFITILYPISVSVLTQVTL